MKWENVGGQIYQSGEWVISNKKTFLNSHHGWYIYLKGIYVADARTLGEAKILVEDKQKED